MKTLFGRVVIYRGVVFTVEKINCESGLWYAICKNNIGEEITVFAGSFTQLAQKIDKRDLSNFKMGIALI